MDHLKIDKAHVVNRDIDHQFKICSRDEKTEFIASFLKQQQDNRGVIFCRTKAGAIILGKANLSEWANFRSTRSTSGWSGRVARASKRTRPGCRCATH